MAEALDENGIRAIIFMNIERLSNHMHADPAFNFSKEIAWATFSESREAILKIIQSQYDDKINWITAKMFGFGYWLSNAEVTVW